VVIPVHKKELTPYERISLLQCLEVLQAYPIYIFSPPDLWTDECGLPKHVERIHFPEEYFRNVASYNRLMFSPTFYARFAHFEYILVYQLDAFVFSDQLSYWCGLSYDFIGAPWLGLNRREQVRGLLPIWERKGLLRTVWNKEISNVGNGGFSLRRVRTFLVLSTLLKRQAKAWSLNEDTFWSFISPCYYPFFRKPAADVALRFSFELEPRAAYELNQQRLPFGCHAWWRYDFDFWRHRIGALGHSL